MRPVILDAHLRDLREDGLLQKRVLFKLLPHARGKQPELQSETFFVANTKLFITGLDIFLRKKDEFTLFRTPIHGLGVKIVRPWMPRGMPEREIRTSCYRIRDILPMK